MELLIIRHAKAEDYAQSGGDAQRALVEKGFAQSRRIAGFLKSKDLVPDIILTSPYLRSQQTAETICHQLELSNEKLIQQTWLSCGMGPDQALSELKAFSDFERVAIVGHEPDLSMFINHCLGASYPGVEVKKASVHLLELQLSNGTGMLKLSLPPKYI